MKTFEHIRDRICEDQEIVPDQLQEDTRQGCIVFARYLIMFFAYKKQLGTLRHIADQFGKDHATVSHSIKTINNYIDTDNKKRELIFYYAKEFGISQEVILNRDRVYSKCPPYKRSTVVSRILREKQ